MPSDLVLLSCSFEIRQFYNVYRNIALYNMFFVKLRGLLVFVRMLVSFSVMPSSHRLIMLLFICLGFRVAEYDCILHQSLHRNQYISWN